MSLTLYLKPWLNGLASRCKSRQACKTRTCARTCDGWRWSILFSFLFFLFFVCVKLYFLLFLSSFLCCRWPRHRWKQKCECSLAAKNQNTFRLNRTHPHDIPRKTFVPIKNGLGSDTSFWTHERIRFQTVLDHSTTDSELLHFWERGRWVLLTAPLTGRSLPEKQSQLGL